MAFASLRDPTTTQVRLGLQTCDGIESQDLDYHPKISGITISHAPENVLDPNFASGQQPRPLPGDQPIAGTLNLAPGVDEIVPFDAGHSAFASRPRALAELLLGESRVSAPTSRDPERTA